ncbi:hypothetical protein [Nocardia sp.]|uniref:hypothetical protein n=1 Tax=Nocardia sp. TaxID=1821 RepID=UPI002630A90A|nr:hypothetical protein [Nocardia sp.]
MTFEYRVAALLLSRLLRGSHAPVGFQLPVRRVALQQRNAGYDFDDIVVFGQQSTAGPRMQIQVKHRVNTTGADSEFIKVMRAAVAVCTQHSEDLRDGSLRMVLAAGDDDGLTELSELTRWAMSRSKDVGFDPTRAQPFTNRNLAKRYTHVATAVATAADLNSEAETMVLVHQILAALRVWQVQPEPDGQDWRTELDGLTDLAARAGCKSSDLLEHLFVLAQGFGPREAVIDGDQLRGELHSQYGLDLVTRNQQSPIEGSSIAITINHTGSGTAMGANNIHIKNFNAGA